VKKYAYRALAYLDVTDLVIQLNKLTDSGWKLHSFVPNSNVVILEREVTQ
jgi:hypothetical protein